MLSFLRSSSILSSKIPHFQPFSTFSTPFLAAKKVKKVKKDANIPQKPKSYDVSNFKQILLVSSAKGGVGKSTVATNIAVALSQIIQKKTNSTEIKVGILDCDVLGPSVHQMFGSDEKPEVFVENEADGTPKYLPNGEVDAKMIPNEIYGTKIMSIGLIAEEGEAIIWRGPIVTGVLEQLLCTGVKWGELDFLVVDLPPGTGDIVLTLAQKLEGQSTPYDAVVVSTPQSIALSDVSRGISMFSKVKIPVLGIIENMSYYECKKCGEKDYIFGKKGAEELAEEKGIKFLGEIPIITKIRENGDAGTPVVVENPESTAAKSFMKIAEKIYNEIQKKKEVKE